MLGCLFFLRRLSSTISNSQPLEIDPFRDPQKRGALLQKIIERIWKSAKRAEIHNSTILQIAVDELGVLLHLDRCCFLWYFPNKQGVQVVCERVTGSQKPWQGGHYPLEMFGSAAGAIAQGELVVNSGSCSGTLLSTAKKFLERLPIYPFQTADVDRHRNETGMGATANLLVPVLKERTGIAPIEDCSMGCIACFRKQPHTWSTAEIEFVQLIAQQMEIAIRQSQIYAQSQKLLAQEQLLNQITNQTRQSFDLETILTEAIAQLLEALNVDRCLVHMVEDAGDLKQYRQHQSMAYCETTHRLAHRRQHLYEVCRETFAPSIDDFHPYGPITQWVIQHGQSVVIPDITQDARIGSNNEEYRKAQIKSSLVVPVQTKDKLHAILYLNQCSHIRSWSKSDRELAQAVANQLAISIQQACLFAQTRVSMEREALLRLIGDQIRSTLNLKTILQTAVREVRLLLDTDRAVIYQFQQNLRDEVVVEEVTDDWISIKNQGKTVSDSQTLPDYPLVYNECFLKEYAYLYQGGRVRIVNDVSKADLADCYKQFLQRLQVQASIVVPILTGKNLWGLLIVHECKGVRVWQTSEVELLQQVATQVAIAIGQAELYEQARTAALTAQSKAAALERASAALQQANQTLENEIGDRKQAQAALRQKNKIVKLLQAVAEAANEAATSKQALRICLEHICNHTGWPVGHVYLPDQTGELIPTTLWCLKHPEHFQRFRKATEATRLAPGIGLPGQVLSSRKAKWIVDVSNLDPEPNFPRAKHANDLGVKAGFAFPVLVGTEVVAVLEFYSSEAIEPDEQLLEVVANIGTQLGRVVERERAEKALRESEAKAKEQAYQLEQTLYKLQQTQTQLIQTEKMSSLGQLVAGVAHEINNPVNFIHGNLAFADRYAQDLLELVHLYQKNYPKPVLEIQERAAEIDLEFLIEDLPKILSSMQVGTERIRQIVLSLRNFSRLDQAKMKPVDIHEGIDSTLLILQNRLKAKDSLPEIEIVKEYGDLPQVECYAGQLNQVFMNIISNGIDALEEVIGNKLWLASQRNDRPPTIRIRTEMTAPNTIAVRISDNGLGMTEEVKAKLFDPFFTTKPVGKGTGLGLSICYQIVVEKHGGSLRCESLPGQGTEFWIVIPVQQNID
jgi:GAF domain-containing protein